MKEVKIHDCRNNITIFNTERWVKHEDYQQLQKENEELKTAKGMAHYYCNSVIFMPYAWESVMDEIIKVLPKIPKEVGMIWN
jgi:hypothetical protein